MSPASDLSTKRPAILSSAWAPTAVPGMIRTWPVDDPAGRFPGLVVGRVEPPGELGHRIVIRWVSSRAGAPELPGVSRCGPDGDADALVADPQAAVEALLEDDRTAGPTASVAPSRQGEIPVRPADRAVPADPPGVVEAEDRRATQPVGPRPPGGVGSAAGTANRALCRRRKPGRKTFASSIRVIPSRRNSVTSRSWSVFGEPLDPALRLRPSGPRSSRSPPRRGLARPG